MAALPSGLKAPVARLGVLGGTFDPIHDAHLAVAAAARTTLSLDAVLFVPAGDPWRKQGRAITPAPARLEMAQLAVAATGEPAFVVSDIEVRRSGPTYTEDTLRALHDEGHGQLWFIVGADALLDLPHWHDPAALIELARFAVAPRPDHPLDLDALERRVPGLRAAVDMIAMEPIDLSATAIRAGGALDDRIPAAVREYAARHDLYTAGQ